MIPRLMTSNPLLEKNDLHQVLADVMDIPLDGCQQHLAFAGGSRPLDR